MKQLDTDNNKSSCARCLPRIEALTSPTSSRESVLIVPVLLCGQPGTPLLLHGREALLEGNGNGRGLAADAASLGLVVRRGDSAHREVRHGWYILRCIVREGGVGGDVVEVLKY